MMNWRNVTEMEYEELCIEEVVVDDEYFDAYREGDEARANDLHARLVEIRNELDKREWAVSDNDEALDMIKEETDMTENLIYAMRKEGLNFYTCDNEVWVVNEDGFELTATCNAESIAMHGVAGSKIHEGMTSISGFVAAARDWLA